MTKLPLSYKKFVTSTHIEGVAWRQKTYQLNDIGCPDMITASPRSSIGQGINICQVPVVEILGGCVLNIYLSWTRLDVSVGRKGVKGTVQFEEAWVGEVGLDHGPIDISINPRHRIARRFGRSMSSMATSEAKVEAKSKS